jgi:hypothetical protein
LSAYYNKVGSGELTFIDKLNRCNNAVPLRLCVLFGQVLNDFNSMRHIASRLPIDLVPVTGVVKSVLRAGSYAITINL